MSQSIACEKDWRLLLPVSRLTPYYHSLRKGHESVEKVFRHWRDRYGVAGKNAERASSDPASPSSSCVHPQPSRSNGSASASATAG